MKRPEDDPYAILGVPRDAGAEEIERAFRRLAFQYHPDKRVGDREAEERFRKITAAYTELHAMAEEVARGMPSKPSERTVREAFYGASSPQQAEGPPKGTIRRTVRISFEEAARGSTRTVELRERFWRLGKRRARRFELKIPAGIESGTVLRLRGAGSPPRGGGPSGDLLVKVMVQPHTVLRRDGLDVRSSVAVPLTTAVFGGRVAVQTIRGLAEVTVPPRTEPGSVIRLRGAGIPAAGGRSGDHLVRVRIHLPRRLSREQVELLREMEGEPGGVRRPGLLRRLWPFRGRPRA